MIESPRRAMTVFSIGSVIFFICAAMIFTVNRSLEPSLEQEKAVLLWLIIGGTAFFFALNAQICMIIQRLKYMGQR
jgi:hypothetical protein